MTRTKVIYRDWRINVDKRLTEKEYSKIDKSSAESCRCVNCLNYITNRALLFPDEICQLFESLGINRNKEIEISHLAQLQNGLHYYSGWFHVVGEFKGQDCSIPLVNKGYTLQLTQVTDDFGIGFTEVKTKPIFKTEQNLIQVEFDCKIPWNMDAKL